MDPRKTARALVLSFSLARKFSKFGKLLIRFANRAKPVFDPLCVSRRSRRNTIIHQPVIFQRFDHSTGNYLFPFFNGEFSFRFNSRNFARETLRVLKGIPGEFPISGKFFCTEILLAHTSERTRRGGRRKNRNNKILTNFSISPDSNS